MSADPSGGKSRPGPCPTDDTREGVVTERRATRFPGRDTARLYLTVLSEPERNCAGYDVDEFFPDAESKAGRATEVCRGCPVLDACLGYALARPEKYGVWGGTTAEERERRRQRRDRTGDQRPAWGDTRTRESVAS